jgi:capsular exopolysaccharide synthesis family protein
MSEYRCVEKFKQSLTVERVPKTTVVNIAFMSTSPALAETVANATVNAYIEQGFRSRYESTNRVADWLGTKLDDLRKQVESSQTRLLTAQKSLGVLDPSSTHDTSIYVARLQSLYLQYAAAQNQTLMLEAEDQMSQAGKIPVILTNSAPMAAAAVSSLQGQVDSLKAQVSSYKATYGPNYPLLDQATQQLQQAEKQLDIQIAQLRTQINTQYQTAKRNEGAIQSAINEQTKQISNLSGETIKFSQAAQEYDANRLLYQGLLTRLREAGVLAGLSSNSVDILDIARLPVAASAPNRKLFIVVGSTLGLLIGCGLGIIRDALKTGFKSIEDVEQTIRLPVVGVLPQFRHSSSAGGKTNIAENAFWVSHNPQSQIAEAFRSLRTAILLSRPDHPPKVLMVSSSIAGEGKTTISINLAAVLSQSGAKVLLIDADLRRPALSRRLGIPSGAGLSDLLSGALITDSILRDVDAIPGLKVLSSGPVPPFPAELLGSEKMREVVSLFREKFDYIVIDTAPLLAVTDPTLVALLSDINLLVIRHAGATRAAVTRASEILSSAGLGKVALILNSLDQTTAKYMGYYGVGDYYKDQSENL